ncbi:MAG: LPS export ABC transporter periplasmic protein LptC [Pyrinomonadaceae bacterium]|nr:LPS export ABC transporter periplasmic protein LptC [Pyrinomonadaceae bacterium]
MATETTIKKPLKPVSGRRVSFVGLRARFPFLLRYVAVAVVALTLIAVAGNYWRSRNNQDFRMKGQNPELTSEITAVVNGYERRVTVGDKLKLLVRADKDTTFADNRHELENVYLENHPNEGDEADIVTAKKAIFTPDAASPDNFVLNFIGDVNFKTRDSLAVQTQQIIYDKTKETAETAELINFTRANLSGNAVGANLNIKEKHLELLSNVEINVAPKNGDEPQVANNSLTDFGKSAVAIRSGRASFDQDLARFELSDGVNINITPTENNQKTDASDLGSQPVNMVSTRAVWEQIKDTVELSGGVNIIAGQPNAPTTIRCDNATYRRRELEYILRENAEIVFVSTQTGGTPVTVRGKNAFYNEKSGKANLTGEASAEQGFQLMRGETIAADLSKTRQIQHLNIKNNAYLRTNSGERNTEVSAVEVNFQFDEIQRLQTANAAQNAIVTSQSAENALKLDGMNNLDLTFQPDNQTSLLKNIKTIGQTNAQIVALNSADYSNIILNAPTGTETAFDVQNNQSVLRQMQTGGRTTVSMSAPQSQSNNPKATNKKLVADAVKIVWNANGKDVKQAFATGNAELYIIPLGAGANVDRQTVFAQKFDCDFYETGNLAKSFAAIGNANAIIEPTQPTQERGTRNLFADNLTANFERNAQTVENFAASGNAKFNEADRNGVANNFVYTANDETVRLRGGEPTTWDNRARLKAAEIDWNTRTQQTFLRGKVATTYYSQGQTNGATPFTKVNSPVFLTSNQAEFNSATGIGVYTGSARAWQDENYVSAERLILQRDNKAMIGDGNVQSSLYNTNQRTKTGASSVPVFATSQHIEYSDANKVLRYEKDVDIKQGTDRITSGIADVYLNSKNDMEKTIAQNSVVVTQPGRKATGDSAQYTAVDEVVILRGNPAFVEDAVNGNSQAKQLTVFLRENRVVGQGGNSPVSPGRIRSTHKIKKQ